MTTVSKSSYTLWQMVYYALKLGTVGFGGPVALIGYMYRDLVEEKKWISEAEYKEGLTLAQLAPGPLAAQLAIYLGYCHYRILGATLVGLAFVLPSFIMVVALGWAYVRYNGLIWMQAIFYGISACIIGIIARSAQKLTLKTLGRDFLLWTIFGIMVFVTFITEYESILLIIVAGILTWSAISKAPGWKVTESQAKYTAATLFILAGFAIVFFFKELASLGQNVDVIRTENSSILWDIFWLFTKAGAFVFGSGLAIVPFLFGGVVNGFHWLNEQQFMDSVAVAMITPGPVVITTGFIGYLIEGFVGACVAAFATFFPCYLITVIAAPWMRKYGNLPEVVAAVNGVIAGAVGAIAGAVLVLGKRSIFDIPTFLIAVGSYVILSKFKKISEPILIIFSGIIGLIIKGV